MTEPLNLCIMVGNGQGGSVMAGILVLAKLLGFVQISSPGRGRSGTHVTMGLDAFGGP